MWHTTYTGNSFETMKASYGVNVNKLKKTPDVWQQDAMLRDMTKFSMSKKDTEEVNGYLSQAGKFFNQISGTTLRELEANPKLAQMVETFNNTYVRKGEIIRNTTQHTNNLIKWINSKFDSERMARKSPRGQSAVDKRREEVLKFFSVANKKSLIKMFDLQKVMVLAKLKLINILNKLKRYTNVFKNKKRLSYNRPRRLCCDR